MRSWRSWLAGWRLPLEESPAGNRRVFEVEDTEGSDTERGWLAGRRLLLEESPAGNRRANEVKATACAPAFGR